ncbi:MAG TPA: helicase-related protein [bacterium]|nr:helicase-related protein [bacterium]
MDYNKIIEKLGITNADEKKLIEKKCDETPEAQLSFFEEIVSIHRNTYNYYITDDLESVYEYWPEPSPECDCPVCSELISGKKELIKQIKQNIFEKKKIDFNKKIGVFLNNLDFQNLAENDFDEKIEAKLKRELRRIMRAPYDLSQLQIKNKAVIKYWGDECEQLIDLYRKVRNNILVKRLIVLNENNPKQIDEDYAELGKKADKNPFMPVEKVITSFHRKYKNIAAANLTKKSKTTNEIKEREISKLINQSINIHTYHDFFVLARRMKRRITFFMGETCSGKTYLAHNILAKAKTGIYLAPLRLLALEGQEEQRKRGVLCSFLTGEEQDFVEGATHLSSTIEMINLNNEVDAAVIDEIQMIGDAQRGWAWSQALLGVPAKHIILTGSPNALSLVKRIADLLGEPLKVVELKRLTELKVEKSPVEYYELQKKDCIVAFSRREVLQIKFDIEKRGFKVSVIYGGLPPEVRREESRRFNSEETDILVATDAIAMGLNLPIRRVIFFTTVKVFNRKIYPLSISEIRQIGGRAGRYGREETGYVTAFNSKDLQNIKNAFSAKIPVVELGNIIPTFEHIRIISEITGEKEIGVILKHFQKYVIIDSDMFCLSDLNEILYKTQYLKKIKNLEIAFPLSVAPVDIKDKFGMEFYKNFVDMIRENLVIPAPTMADLGTRNFKEISALKELESFIKVCNLFNWLHFRFPDNCKDIETCSFEKSKAVDIVIETLNSEQLIKKCSTCGRPLPLDFAFTICNGCYNRRYTKKFYGGKFFKRGGKKH